MAMKEVLKQHKEVLQDLLVFDLIKKGYRPSQICSKFKINKKTLQNHLSSLKRQGFIRKMGYGVWEIIKEFDQKEVLKSTKVANDNMLMGISKPDQVRGHAFQFTLKIPQLRNWDKREDIFTKKGIKFSQLITGMGKIGQKIMFKGRKIWITDNSIIVFEKASYMSETAEGSKSHAIYDFKNLINSLERHLKADFNFKGRLLFRISRQHYSLVKNALARQYDREGKKLEVYDEGGFWLSIDNSFNLHELETIHPKTADQDNKKVQDFFNGIKQYEGFTPLFLMETMGKCVQSTIQNAQNLDQYVIHLKAHVESVKQLGSAVEELTKVVKDIKEKKDL